MELCSDDHDEVCFEGNECPVCEEKEKREEAEEKLSNMVDALKVLRGVIMDPEVGHGN